MTFEAKHKSAERKVGNFSTYQCKVGERVFHGQDVPFLQKPAQQLLTALGCKFDNPKAYLSMTEDGKPLNITADGSVEIYPFGLTESKDKLQIEMARIKELLNSAKIYVNTDIVPEKFYASAVAAKGVITEQDQSTLGQKYPGQLQEVYRNLYLQNLATNICHAQEIELLVTQERVQNGESHSAFSAPRNGKISAGKKSILLLSSPALNFDYGVAKQLTVDESQRYIAGMFRNLFSASLSEGRNYIAMPAAGLGVFGGNPELYFNTLFAVAREFKALNIIYHPGSPSNVELFNRIQKSNGDVKNVRRATKDVVFIADELTKAGDLCALHNPSDADALFGVYDIGEYWKDGKGSRYVGEEHIGSMTTAPINSFGLNPAAYQNVVERSCALQAQAQAPRRSRHSGATHVVTQQQPRVAANAPVESGVPDDLHKASQLPTDSKGKGDDVIIAIESQEQLPHEQHYPPHEQSMADLDKFIEERRKKLEMKQEHLEREQRRREKADLAAAAAANRIKKTSSISQQNEHQLEQGLADAPAGLPGQEMVVPKEFGQDLMLLEQVRQKQELQKDDAEENARRLAVVEGYQAQLTDEAVRFLDEDGLMDSDKRHLPKNEQQLVPDLLFPTVETLRVHDENVDALSQEDASRQRHEAENARLLKDQAQHAKMNTFDISDVNLSDFFQMEQQQHPHLSIKALPDDLDLGNDLPQRHDVGQQKDDQQHQNAPIEDMSREEKEELEQVIALSLRELEEKFEVKQTRRQQEFQRQREARQQDQLQRQADEQDQLQRQADEQVQRQLENQDRQFHQEDDELLQAQELSLKEAENENRRREQQAQNEEEQLRRAREESRREDDTEANRHANQHRYADEEAKQREAARRQLEEEELQRAQERQDEAEQAKSAELAKVNVKKFDELLTKLQITTGRLISTADKDKSYKVVKKSAETLIRELQDAKTQFQAKDNKISAAQFKVACETAVSKAEGQFKNHRGLWFKSFHPIVRAILGVLATVTIVPALIVAVASKPGYKGTFFATPEPKAKIALDEFSNDFVHVVNLGG